MGENIKENRDCNVQQNNLTIAQIYNSVKNLGHEEQVLILSNYKVGDLYKLYNDEEEFCKYLKMLEDTASLYIQTANALVKHREEAVAEGGLKWESDMVRTMEEAYDNMTEWGQEKFCQEMGEKAGFFVKMYKMVMGKLNHALRLKEVEGNAGESVEN